ncbi:PAS domain S-box protein, partial [Methanosarcina sp. UBA5]|uniref:PAS domain S-box protein n=1 Tax=Methanosarcina sp. UBA5 TaxID=1915593 RepID=UPI0025EA823E
MEAKVDQNPATNSNPVLSIDKNGCIVYSNEAGNLLLNEWEVKIGDKLPSSIIDLVQKVITQNNPEKMEVRAGKRVYLIVFHPLPEQGCVNISGFDISDQKKAEEETKDSEERLIALMDHSPSLLFMKDECGRYVYLNNAYEKQFVHSKDWYGKTDFDFWPKESAELFRKNDSLVLKSGKIHQFMEDSTDLNGTRYCWLNYKFPFTDSKNKKYIGGIGIDATDRVRAEEALQESEERYRTLFTNMTEGFGLAEVIYNSEGKPIDYRYLEVNPAFELYFGVKREQLLGKTMRETFPKLSPIAIEKYNEVALSDQPINFEIFSHVANKYLDIHAFIPEKGKVALILRDISERKEAEAKLKDTLDNLDKLVKESTLELQKAYDSLKKSERNLAEAQEIAHIGSWERDFANNELHWSDETYRIFGLKPQESKVNYDTFLNYVHPEDRSRVDNAIKEALKGKPFDIDYRIITANGEERIAHEKAEVIFDEKKNPIRLRGTVQDITEHRKAEENIRNLANVVESSTEAIITESFEGIITSWNKGAEQVYGYSAEEIIGKSISILEPPTLTGETHRLCEIIKRGEKIQQYETLRLRNDGKLINVSLSIFPVFDNKGKITAASIIATDITRRKEAEERLRESEEKYRNIVETSNEGIYLVDDEGKITYANKIMETSGYTLEEIIGRPIWDFISEERMPVANRNFEKRRQGINDSYELKLMRKDGSFIWGLVSAKSLFNKEGKFIGYLGMLTDIT